MRRLRESDEVAAEGYVLDNRRGKVTAIFGDGARLVAVEGRVMELLASLLKLGESVRELEVIPEDGGGFKIASRGAWMDGRDAAPVGGGTGEIFPAGGGGFGVQVAEGGETIGSGGLGLGETGFDGDGLLQRGGGGVEVGEGAKERNGTVAGVGVGGVLLGDGIEQGRRPARSGMTRCPPRRVRGWRRGWRWWRGAATELAQPGAGCG